MKHGSLFSGIGGFDLAAEWMGWENKFHCEINPFGQQVLKYYWPAAESFTDITKTDFTKYANTIDILTGGFPCQPYSTAGKRLGKEDDRHLWPEMLRAIREIQPCYVVGENVRGLTNWNGGLVFDEVQADLENEGYEVLPFLFPACAVNAPHRRDRIWFIAYSGSNGGLQYRGTIPNRDRNDKEQKQGREQQQNGIIGSSSKSIAATHTENIGCECRANSDRRNEGQLHPHQQGQHKADGGEFIGCGNDDCNTKRQGLQGAGRQRQRFEQGSWSVWPTVEPTICSGDNGLPTQLDGITFSKWRQESIKGFGNAIVPQAALQIFKAIEQMELLEQGIKAQ